MAVVTKPDRRSGRGQKSSAPKVKLVAESTGIEVVQPERVSEIEGLLALLRPDIGVLSAYGQIIPEAIINSFPKGIINIHPSLLPKYRGPSPIEAAILNGDPKTGISLMELSRGMDEGPVYYQKEVELDGRETKTELYEHLAAEGAKLLAEKLPDIAAGRLKPQPQDSSKATYTKLLTKKDGQLDWSEPAEKLEREIRAYQGYPKPRGLIHGYEVIINRARLAGDDKDGRLIVRCAPGWLEILELTAPSGRIMSGADFLRGYIRPS